MLITCTAKPSQIKSINFKGAKSLLYILVLKRRGGHLMKITALIGLIFFSISAQAIELKIVKKSSTISHNIIDTADEDSQKSATSLRDQLSRYSASKDGFDVINIKEEVHTVKEKPTYEATPVKNVKLPTEANDEKDEANAPLDLPGDSEHAISTEEAINKVKSTIESEFEDEISSSEVNDEEIYSAGIDY